MSDLDQLDGVAAAADAGAMAADNVGQPEEAQAPEVVSTQAKAERHWGMLAGMVGAYEPAAGAVLEGRKAELVAVSVPVMEKYPEYFSGELPCELVFAAVAGPTLWQAGKIVLARVQADKAAAAQPARPAPGIESAKAMPQDRPAPPERHPQEALYKVPV